MANIHGLGPVGGGKDKKGGNEEFSVGGASSQSAVYRPPGGGGGGLNDQLLNQARQNQGQGAEAVGDKNLGTITLYKNGFIIGDGAFRDSKDPENERCLKELMEGNVPRDLEPAVREQFPGAHQVGINLVNRSQEEFVPPPPTFSFAESQGQSLGGAQQAEIVSFAEAVPQQYQRKEDEEKAGMVQLVTADRKRVRLEVSEATRVIDVFQHMMSLSGHGPDEFVLAAGFPPKPLEDALATLVDQKLIGSSIEQRLVKK